ncbi:OmpA family protein [Profundibacterium mesophilum]|uniref:Outer membrane protein OmpAMotB family protein n=1 Tax=Profundibacterium mesophilum KAUST100406-0324 TaxID=1037889 RepID=A0A921NQV0_9RHOB|nr:OmpA family protein [Profundibacterium mesophilum]KAF0675815.1 Outer membrane protein OmpAMotB family protein [Profundibacterium mesophilum KAUST100406-0324]
MTIRSRPLRAALAIASAAILGACAPGTGPRSFDQVAGGALDRSGFGNATLINTQVQSGALGQVEGLNNRFSAEVDSVVTFAFDSAVLDASARAVLNRQASWIRQFPEVRFRVFGHTDLVGSDAYNKALGLRRAQAVVAHLATRGISPARLEALVSFGETQPLIVTQGRARANRRTVTEVSGFVGQGDRVLNGKYAEVIFREYVQSAIPVPQGGSAPGATLAAPAGG